eukprot:937039-Rhodomonas_salina.1
MVLTKHHVTFYYNTRRLERVALPAPLSDCFNDGTGILIGSNDMEIGDLRFHPTGLTVNGIEELFFNGGALDDLASGSADPCPLRTACFAVHRCAIYGVFRVTTVTSNLTLPGRSQRILQSRISRPWM